MTTLDLKTLKTASPKEIDAVLAEMWGREQAAAFAAYRAEEGAKALEARPPRTRRTRPGGPQIPPAPADRYGKGRTRWTS
jgi:hypothetical protein